MSNRLKIAIISLVALIASPTAVLAADNEPFSVTATGVGPTGFLKVIVEAYHDVYRDAYPGTSATFVPGTVTGGMVQAASGQVDVTVGVTPVELIYGLTGKPPFREPLKGKILQAFTMFDTLNFWFIASKSWAEENGIESLADIAEKKPSVRIAMGSLSTPYINDTANAIFKELGFSIEEIESWGGSVHHYPSGRGIDDLRDGKVDMQIIAGLQPDARLIDLNRTRPLIWLKVDKDVLEKVASEVDMSVNTLPGDTYDFLNGDIATIRVTCSLMAGAHVPEETIYKIVRSIGENIERVRKIHPALHSFSPEVMVMKSRRVDYHPGALRYYKEKGWVD